jgi:hypothetical protein
MLLTLSHFNSDILCGHVSSSDSSAFPFHLWRTLVITCSLLTDNLHLFYFILFIIFTFTLMCIHCLGHHHPTTPTPLFQAEPAPPSCSLILLNRKHKG